MSRRLLAKLGLALLAALGATELALHLAPALLPNAYLARFPGNGTEFFQPDVFARTPVEGVLLPHRAGAYRGPPPADLIELGIAPRTADADARAFPAVELPADALGFPNARALERVELVLVGDSFGVAAGVRQPEGLQAALERVTGQSVFNLSLAGLGPAQERWLLETVGLAKQPRAVLWFFFSGNDLTASYEPFLARRAGHATWAEAWPELRKPALLLPDLLRHIRSGASAPRREPLPPFRFARPDGSVQELWFLPDQLAQLGTSLAEWRAHPAWAPVQGELRAAREACAAHGAKLLLVYLPSAPEVLLPLVERDAELAARTCAFLQPLSTPASEPGELFLRQLANRHAQEELLRDFCSVEGIPFLSAVPALEAQARRGELGYLTTDTHWQSVGQAALLEPLLDFLRAND